MLDMVFFVVMPDEAVWVFDGFLQPFEVQLRLFLVAERRAVNGNVAKHRFCQSLTEDMAGFTPTISL